ncbi:MAG TPA: hypothetical protein VN771_05735 [Candidatus Baltobacteraceae bacterium]|nr:hypothetical protein [Candidatus Baltobacteraceae bacterium]
MYHTMNLSRIDLRITAAGMAIAVAAGLLCVDLGERPATLSLAHAALAVPVARGATVSAAAIELAGRFGLAGTPGAPVRTADQVTGEFLDTVDFRRADGRLAAEVVRAVDGRLVRLVDLTDPPRGPETPVDAARAPTAARRLLGASGLAAPASPPVTTWDAGMDAWCVRWVRTIDGVPAPTDGLVTWVRPSGRLKALSDIRSPLAAAPAEPVTAGAATLAVRAYLRRLHLDRMADLVVDAPRLAWVLPNAFVDPAAGSGPSTLRLAWTITLGYVPPGWSDRHAVEVDVDAATGALIGGTETA